MASHFGADVGAADAENPVLAKIYALARAGDEGFMVIDGPDDHITTVPSAHEAWQFPSQQGAAMAARTISRWTGASVEVVQIQ
jgi:hypothetical protein